MKLCPECGNPPAYTSFCSLCSELFFRSRWKKLPRRQRDAEFKRVYSSTPSIQRVALVLNISEQTVYDLRARLNLPSISGYPRGRWTPEQDAEFERLLIEGITRRDASARLGRSIKAMKNRREQLGLAAFKRSPSHRKGLRHPLEARVAELRAAGLSYRQTARKLRISRNAVASIIYRHINPRRAKDVSHDAISLPDLRPANRAARAADLPEFEHGRPLRAIRQAYAPAS